MHTFIAGISNSGKTVLAKALCADWRRRGFSPLVCDPKAGQWAAHRVYLRARELMEVLRLSERVPFFVDECGQTIGHGRQADELQWLATASRAHGHLGHFICQGFTQIPPIYRDQCTRGYVFRQSPTNAALLAEHFSDAALLDAPALGQGEFLLVEPFKQAKRQKLAL